MDSLIALGVIMLIVSVGLLIAGIVVLIVQSMSDKPLRPAAILLAAAGVTFLISLTLCTAF
jgi:hypothetical protein